MQDEAFWKALDTLVADCKLVIDRPKGSHHPRYPHIVYEADYGYLAGTSSMDGGGIDVWRGEENGARLNAVLCTVDLMKKDSEIKLLIACSEEDIKRIYSFHNSHDSMKAILIIRPDEM